MDHTLMKVLRKENCTVQELRSVLDSEPNLINESDSMYTPLYLAILYGQSSEVVRELIIRGANVNETTPLGYCHIFAACLSILSCGTKHLKILQILLKCGADININGFSDKSPLCIDWFIIKNLEPELLTSLFQTLLEYADGRTKRYAYFYLLYGILDYKYCKGKEIYLKNYFLILKLLVESKLHAIPHFTIDFVFKHIISLSTVSKRLSIESIPFMMKYFKTVLPHTMAHICCEYCKEMFLTYHVKENLTDYFETIEITNARNYEMAELLFKYFSDLWNKCLKQTRKMQQDVVVSKRSVFQVLQDVLGSKLNNCSIDECHEILLKINKCEYSFFSDLMKQVVHKSDVIELYALLLERYSVKCVIITDVFYYVAQYLLKDDIINFMLAMLPKQRDIHN